MKWSAFRFKPDSDGDGDARAPASPLPQSRPGNLPERREDILDSTWQQAAERFDAPSDSGLAIAGDARSQQDALQKVALKEMLRRRLADRETLLSPADPDEQSEPENENDTATQSAAKRLDVTKFVKTLIGVALVMAVGWQPLQRLFQVSSVEAVVNARLITIRASIPGTVETFKVGLPGQALRGGDPLLNIANERADRTRLDDLRRDYSRVRDEKRILRDKLQRLRLRQTEVKQRVAAFQKGRVLHLQARIDVLKADRDAAIARRKQADATLSRQQVLLSKGVIANARLEEAASQSESMGKQVAAHNARIRAAEVELNALRNGSYIGDSYNDRPSSSQYLDQLTQKLVAAETERKRLQAEEKRLRTILQQEQARYDRLALQQLRSPVSGRVWEVMTAPGEQVARGQDMLRLLDCSGAIVTATVSEAVYNGLGIGQPAKFRLSKTGEELAGEVVQLTGFATAPANLAILPSALIKESYRVMVKVPALADGGKCHVGKTGRVLFE